MKILHYTTLFVILIGCVIASSDIVRTAFHDAVDQRNLETAVRIWQASMHHRYDNAKYLVAKASTAFIVEFAKRAELKSYIAAALYTGGPEATRKEVFGKVSFGEYELAWATDDPEISCRPEHFLDLLGKITKPEDKDRAINNGFNGLFRGKRTECIDPLLEALKSDKDLESRAIRKLFKDGIYYGEIWIERFYDHLAITPSDYADVLVRLARKKGVKDPIFEFLLREADLDDFRAVLNDERYKNLDYDPSLPIDRAFKQALLTTKPAGSRHRTWEKAKLGKEVIDEATTGKNAKEVLDLIGEYFTEEVPESEKVE